MKYVERLLKETEYLQLVKELEQTEADRIFCKHGLSHLLDVARIGWILALERGQEGAEKPGEPLKEKIYLTALLHDLGRLAEVKSGMPHHRAGAALAGELLIRIQYPREEQRDILAAISEHRGEKDAFEFSLEYMDEQKLNKDFINLIKEADNRSRNCFCCSAGAQCNWSKERRNQGIFW